MEELIFFEMLKRQSCMIVAKKTAEDIMRQALEIFGEQDAIVNMGFLIAALEEEYQKMGGKK
jgi:hypothetical protein